MNFVETFINEKQLESVSFESRLEFSLKRSIGRFTQMDLLQDVSDALLFYSECEILDEVSMPYRIKSINSCYRKYEKYYPNREVEKVFNDLLGFRLIVDSFENYEFTSRSNNINIIDMRNGKKKDDGYRGIHLYYQKNHRCYPIEVQVNTVADRRFHDWLHKYVYKYCEDVTIGKQLRICYDNGIISDERTFKEVLENVLLGSKEI